MLSVILSVFVTMAMGQGNDLGDLECFDSVNTCVQLEKLGYCNTNELVRQKCKRSCGTCETPVPTPAPVEDEVPGPSPTEEPVKDGCDPDNRDCCDSVETCPNFKQAGACESRPNQVGQICPYTCGMCGGGKIECSKSALDCYSQQMSCANELRQRGEQITSESLINCVLPKAQQLPETHCCYKFATYQYHCYDKNQNDHCECLSYDAYYAWVERGETVGQDGKPQCGDDVNQGKEFSVRENYFENMRACEKQAGEKLVNSYTYSWELNRCNDVLPNGSVYASCGSAPGSLEIIEYSRSGCRGTQLKTLDIAPGKCMKKKKNALRYNFHTDDCGSVATPSPTKPPVEHQTFNSLSDWQTVCNDKQDAKSCKKCGGKFKKGRCRMSKKIAKKVKCKNLGGDVCSAVGCTADKSGKKIRCSGDVTLNLD